MLLEWHKTRTHSDTNDTIGNQDEVGLNETWTGSVSGTWLKVKWLMKPNGTYGQDFPNTHL